QRLMADNPDLKVFKQRILGKDYFVMDQWQLEELAKVVDRCKVKVVTHGLPPETLRKFFVEPVPSVEQAVADSLAEYGPGARIAVIPRGRYGRPYVANPHLVGSPPQGFPAPARRASLTRPEAMPCQRGATPLTTRDIALRESQYKFTEIQAAEGGSCAGRS